MTHTGYAVFNVELCVCNCYLLPIQRQRFYLISLLDIQQSIHIQRYCYYYCVNRAFHLKNINLNLPYYLTFFFFYNFSDEFPILVASDY